MEGLKKEPMVSIGLYRYYVKNINENCELYISWQDGDLVIVEKEREVSDETK